MSDEPNRDEQPVATPAGIWEHYCERPGCKEWGGFGFSLAGRPARWFCWDHKADGERLLGRASSSE